jgi:hypothetical protein
LIFGESYQSGISGLITFGDRIGGHLPGANFASMCSTNVVGSTTSSSRMPTNSPQALAKPTLNVSQAPYFECGMRIRCTTELGEHHLRRAVGLALSTTTPGRPAPFWADRPQVVAQVILRFHTEMTRLTVGRAGRS